MKSVSAITKFYLFAFGSLASPASAQMLSFETDRFGFSGSAIRYNSIEDLSSGTAGTTVQVGNRDMSLFVTKNRAPLDPLWRYPTTVWISTAYFYTIEENSGGQDKDDPQGDRFYNGLLNGDYPNTGVGAHLLVDRAATSIQTLGMSFGGYDNGTNSWTTFTMSLVGGEVPYDSVWTSDFSFLNEDHETGNTGIFHQYALNITASGLNGISDANGQITSFGHPTGVTGSFTGIFEDEEDGGFYSFNFALNMTNWAYGVGDGALNGNFGPSIFSAPIPEPSTYAAAFAGISLLVVVIRRIRRQRDEG